MCAIFSLVNLFITDSVGCVRAALGTAIAKAGMTLVYGGGNRGLMGAVSAACRVAGGKTLGFVPRVIAEGGGEGSYKVEAMSIVPEETILVDSMHERKAKMAEAAGAGFIGLPGGFGTLEEVRWPSRLRILMCR
jgi:uncharacterized protein (TIGR00730 family)